MNTETQPNGGTTNPPKPTVTRTTPVFPEKQPASKPAPTQLEVALSKVPNPAPLTTALKLSLFVTDSRVPLPREAGRGPEIEDEAALVDWILLAPLAERADEFAAAVAEQWQSIRDQAGENAALLPESADGLLGRDMFALATQEEFRTLAALQADMQRAVRDHEPFAVANATRRHQNLRDDHLAAIKRGEDPGVLHSREAVVNDCIERSRELNQRMRQLTHDVCLPIAREVLKRFDAAIESFLIRVETRDRELSAAVGVAFEPSVEWRAAALLWQRHNSARPGFPHASSWAYPKDLLHGLVQL